ncbi:MAG: helix-turn-helix transcriptional regulator [Treponema sp.]|nr:helix-turn-helix transcriptional regulator [Treponema sp.]MBQ6566857.1 helix-turn-helix transcriptional regulator [Treponema sp.]MBQ7167912.1 helix-turn-helix transcriptional regulator [Treponema sp.]
MLNFSDILRALTDTLILAQLEAGDSYGYQINKSVNGLSGGEFELKEATLYTSFRRLEEKKLISSYWGDEASGARRRYYAITDEGRKLLDENRQDWERILGLVEKLMRNSREIAAV